MRFLAELSLERALATEARTAFISKKTKELRKTVKKAKKAAKKARKEDEKVDTSSVPLKSPFSHRSETTRPWRLPFSWRWREAPALRRRSCGAAHGRSTAIKTHHARSVSERSNVLINDRSVCRRRLRSIPHLVRCKSLQMRSRTTSCANVTTTMFKSRTFIEVPILNGTLDLLVDECNPSGSGLGLLSP